MNTPPPAWLFQVAPEMSHNDPEPFSVAVPALSTVCELTKRPMPPSFRVAVAPEAMVKTPLPCKVPAVQVKLPVTPIVPLPPGTHQTK